MVHAAHAQTLKALTVLEVSSDQVWSSWLHCIQVVESQ